MEDFEDFEDQDDEMEILIRNTEMKHDMNMMRIKLANENYDVVTAKGIDFATMRKEENNDVVHILKVLGDMLEIFEELEEYEKCSKINKILQTA